MLTHEKIVEAVIKAVNEFPLTRAEYFGSYADGYAQIHTLSTPTKPTNTSFWKHQTAKADTSTPYLPFYIAKSSHLRI